MVGCRVVIATTDDDGSARLKAPLEIATNWNGLDHIFFRRNFVFYKVSFGLARWLNLHVVDFDVVHVHALFSFSSLVAARAAERAGVPYIIRPLGVLNRWGVENRRRLIKHWSLRYVEQPILRSAAAIHFTAEAERREAVEAAPEVANRPSVVIPIPIETPSICGDKGGFLAKFPAAAGKRVVLFLSRIDRKKGIELLLEAFRDLRGRFTDALLVIAGDGDEAYIQSLRQRAEKLVIESHLIWAGFLSGGDKAAAFAAATAFVLPSYSENFGIAAAEALAHGVPSVLSDQVAIAAEAGRAGAALVTRCEATELAAAIGRLLDDPEMRNEMSDKAAVFAREQYSLDAVGMQLVELYRKLAGRHPR